MNEKPLEWMAQVGEGAGHKLGRIAALAAAVAMFLFFALSGSIIAMIVLVLFGILFMWLQTHAYVEYEFSYFSDEMDISAIYNKARRKKKMSLKMSDVEYMVKKIEPQQVTKYFCNKNNVSEIYTLVANIQDKRTAIVIEAAPEFVKIMQTKRKVR